ncbi:MAG: DJ-1/PfpI family protein [Oscillospiraceae bacterium]|nr:DJ-1/PfpI family protein [Oscillospiraceae bacterium]
MIYIFLADGFEEIEAVTPLDMLKRCDKEVVTVGVGSENKLIRGAHDIYIAADISEKDIVLDGSLEMIILPGGMPGTANLEKSEYVQRAVDYCAENNVFIGAICAAPSILGNKKLLRGKKAVCYKGWEAKLEGADIQDTQAVQDGNIITARGAGASMEFGFALIEALISKERAEALRDAMLCAR